MTAFTPYANEAEQAAVGDLVLENREDRISIHGQTDLTRDQEGLIKARLLLALVSRIVERLEVDDLPDRIAVVAPKKVKNPFR